jgi:hypothetical protein
MFLVTMVPGRSKWFDKLPDAIEHAVQHSLYGVAKTISIRRFEWSDPLVTFDSERMRHASQRQRKASELQVVSGVHGGL